MGGYDRSRHYDTITFMKSLIQRVLRQFGLEIASRKYIKELRATNEQLSARINEVTRAADDLRLLQLLPEDHTLQLLKSLPGSKSQLRQYLFVLSSLNFKRNGYFVEFGAANGIDFSNTYLLETEYGWRGILAEPARCWHSALSANRRVSVETDCVWRATGETLPFREVADAKLSTLQQYSSIDFHREERQKIAEYQVPTISLVDLLDKYQAPQVVDYLSIDTEGSEYEILMAFDFDRYRFNVITCEHNFTSARERIFDLLVSKGYQRKLEHLSKFDDWYVRSN
jgi:FkbM family methyltransferase